MCQFSYCFNIKIRHGWDEAPCKDLDRYLLSPEGLSVISKPQKCVYTYLTTSIVTNTLCDTGKQKLAH